MRPLAELDVDAADEVVIARLRGEIDTSNAGELTASLISALPETSRGLILDLCEVQYLDSAGIHLILTLTRMLARRQQGVCLVVEPGPVREVLEITLVDKLAPIVGEIEQARAQLRGDPD